MNAVEPAPGHRQTERTGQPDMEDDVIDLTLVRRVLAKMKADARATAAATGETDEAAQRLIRKYEKLLKAEVARRREGELHGYC